MSRSLLIGAGATALLTAAALAPGLAAETSMLNPLLPTWTGPYGGVPPFDKVKVEQFKPALEAGMAETLKEIDAIANDTAPPTFQNTLAAMEGAGRTFDRVQNVFGIYSGNMSTDEFQAVETEMAPQLAAFGDKITQNEKLFKRIAAVYEARETSNLTPEQKRLSWLVYTNFVRGGAKLDPTAKKRLSEINQRLASLYTSFTQNVLADETTYVTVLDKESDLAGLPDSVRASAAAAADSRGHKGKWAVINTRSSVEPFLSYSDRRDLREKVWRTFVNRGDNGGREGQQQADHRDPEAPRRAREAPRLHDPRPLAPRELHGQDPGAGDAAPGGGVDAGGRARPRRGRGHAGHRGQGRRQGQDRALGLPLLRGEGPQGQVRPRRERGEAVPPAREAPRGDVLGGGGDLRPALHARDRSPRLPSRRPRLGGEGRVRQARGPLVLRSLRAAGQAVRGLDERVPHPGEVRAADHDHRVQQLELREGQARRADPHQLDRRQDALPRVRPRASRPELERDLSVARRHQRRPRLRRVPVAAPRALAVHARGAEPVRAPLPDRAADPARRWSRRSSAPRPSTRASTPSSTWPARWST